MIDYLFYKTKWSLGICILSLICLSVLASYTSNRLYHIKNLEHDFLSLSSLAARSQEAEKFINAHKDSFASFQACNFEESFLSGTICNSLPYRANFGPPSILEEQGNRSLFTQEASFEFSCLLDTEIFTFLENLLANGPGIFQLKEVTIHREHSINEEILKGISRGEEHTLFQGRIQASWIHY